MSIKQRITIDISGDEAYVLEEKKRDGTSYPALQHFFEDINWKVEQLSITVMGSDLTVPSLANRKLQVLNYLQKYLKPLLQNLPLDHDSFIIGEEPNCFIFNRSESAPEIYLLVEIPNDPAQVKKGLPQVVAELQTIWAYGDQVKSWYSVLVHLAALPPLKI